VACTSYNGQVFFGLTADRDAMPDVEEFADLISESVEELLQTLPPRTERPPRARRRRPAVAPVKTSPAGLAEDDSGPDDPVEGAAGQDDSAEDGSGHGSGSRPDADQGERTDR